MTLLKEGFALPGDAHAPGIAIEKPDADVVLESRDGFADGRFRHPQRGASCGHSAGLDNSVKYRNVIDAPLHTHPIVHKRKQFVQI